MPRLLMILGCLLTLSYPSYSMRLNPDLGEILGCSGPGPRVFARLFKGMSAANTWYKLPQETRTSLVDNWLVNHLDTKTAKDLMTMMSARHRAHFMDEKPYLLPTTRTAFTTRKNDLHDLHRIPHAQWPYYLMKPNESAARQLMQDICHTSDQQLLDGTGTIKNLENINIVTVTQGHDRQLVLSKPTSLPDAFDYARRQFFKNNRLSRHTLMDRASLRFWTWETMLLGHMLDQRRGFASTDPFIKTVVEKQLVQNFWVLHQYRSLTLHPLLGHLDLILQGAQIPPFTLSLDQGHIPDDYPIRGRPDLLPQGYEDEAQHRQGGLALFFEPERPL